MCPCHQRMYQVISIPKLNIRERFCLFWVDFVYAWNFNNVENTINGIYLFTVNVVDGEMLTITKVSRLHMAPYLCVSISFSSNSIWATELISFLLIILKVASNGVPPSISKRVLLRVQCKIPILNTDFTVFWF